MEKPSILIVDDSEINREVLEVMLADEYQVYHAENGQVAIEMVEKHDTLFRLVLLDIQMPVMNGFEVLTYFSEHDMLKSLPVIIISGDSSNESLLKAYELGAVDFFTKPFAPQIVKSRVYNILSLYQHEYIDEVTESYNRNGFIQVTESFLKSVEDKSKYAIIYFNVINFKVVNEMYDFEGGNLLLQKLYRLLTDCPLHPVCVARVNADHLVCFAEKRNIDYQYFSTQMERKFIINGKIIVVNLVCGVYNLKEDDEIPVGGMIDRAKMAIDYIVDYHVKPYAIFDSSMSNNYIDQAVILNDFEDALVTKQFKVYYQPVVEAATGKLASAEALVRWIHPVRGFVSPASFIPTLERSGHISKLDWYVLEEVYTEMEKRLEEDKIPTIPVSVNLSWMDFCDDNMLEQIFAFMKKSRLPRNRFRYEITETSFAALEHNRQGLLDRFHEAGVKILLDDFGSGYSSFGILQNYSFDILKLDMSFTRQIGTNPKARNIIRAIIDMSHQIGIKVIAEGAENREQVEFLRHHGCDYIQGYYFSKPLPYEEFLEFVERYQKDGKVADPDKIFRSDLRSFFKEKLDYLSTEMKDNLVLDSYEISKALEENAAVGVIGGVYDYRLSIGYISDFALKVLGYTLEEMIEARTDSLIDLTHKDDEYKIRNIFEEQRFKEPIRLRTKTGEYVSVMASSIYSDVGGGHKHWILSVRKLDKQE